MKEIKTNKKLIKLSLDLNGWIKILNSWDFIDASW